jgi:hypothetical protein
MRFLALNLILGSFLFSSQEPSSPFVSFLAFFWKLFSGVMTEPSGKVAKFTIPMSIPIDPLDPRSSELQKAAFVQSEMNHRPQTDDIVMFFEFLFSFPSIAITHPGCLRRSVFADLSWEVLPCR